MVPDSLHRSLRRAAVAGASTPADDPPALPWCGRALRRETAMELLIIVIAVVAALAIVIWLIALAFGALGFAFTGAVR